MDTYESVAQTFTAGLSGGLDQVDLDLSKYGSSPSPANLSVEIRDAPGGLPGSTVLASQSVPASSVGFSLAFVAINFPTPASVVAGTQYAIVAYTSASGYAWAASSTANPYADGDSFVAPSSPPSTSWNPQAGDQAFKTYVVPTPSVVPPTPSVVPPTTSTPAPTGQRAAALNKCKKKHSKKARKKCKKKANLLPV